MSSRQVEEAVSTLEAGLQVKVQRCCEILRGLGKVVVAFSGGVDSTFLLALARHVLGGENVLAAVGVSPSLPRRELDEARLLAEDIGVRLVEVATDELNDPAFASNPSERCFYCKRALLTELVALARREGFAAVLVGANADDAGDFRPGLRAGREMGAAEPLMQAGLTKPDIRAASRALRLPTWNKPSYACLASRIPYGQAITPQRLERIEKAEEVLHRLGLTGCRVRDHDPIARLEVPADQIQRAAGLREQIVGPLKALGYKYVALDLEGFRSGSMNETL